MKPWHLIILGLTLMAIGAYLMGERESACEKKGGVVVRTPISIICIKAEVIEP